MDGDASDSSSTSRLTPLQRDLLEGFFAREQRFFLTGGGALTGFYFGHRDTEDLDLFSPPGPDLAEGARAIEATAAALSATIEALQTYPDFRRFLVRRGQESCLVDLVIDRAPAIDAAKPTRGVVRVDTLREIAANKICTILGRSQIKDLVDLERLLGAGVSLEQALADAATKDRGVDPATLAWLLDQLKISPEARLPGGTDPIAIDEFRRQLVDTLQRMAFERSAKPPRR